MKLPVDRLPVSGGVAEVMWLDSFEVGSAREPHRHDYNELIWVRSGRGRHLLDGESVPVREGTVTLIGRGQVHVFERGEQLDGAVVRFGDELMVGSSERATPGWLLAGRGGRTVSVPPGEADSLEAVVGALDAELRRPPDGQSAQLQRHLVSVLLLWMERWWDAERVERPETDDGDVQLARRFGGLLERDFAHHHEAAHYADALGVPPAALSRALSAVTGRATKELVTDRVMLEAARLLRFTDLGAQEVALRVGFTDPLYFSRAFKRRHGESPMAFRDRAQGSFARKSMHP